MEENKATDSSHKLQRFELIHKNEITCSFQLNAFAALPANGRW